jgi:hypothetical protein
LATLAIAQQKTRKGSKKKINTNKLRLEIIAIVAKTVVGWLYP